MPDFDFGSITTSDVQWPKRGRKPKPLPEELANALRQSLTSSEVPHLVMPMERIETFGNLLSKAGKQLNMRIERHIEENTPEPGLATFHFRARSKRNAEVE